MSASGLFVCLSRRQLAHYTSGLMGCQHLFSGNFGLERPFAECFSLLQRNSSYIQAISVKHTCFTEIIMFQFPNKIHLKRIYCGLGCTSQCVVSGAMGRSDSSYTIASIAASIPLMMSSRERLGVLGRCCTCSCIKGTCMNPPRICGKDLLIW